jgi:CheY-like chemotaxis protein
MRHYGDAYSKQLPETAPDSFVFDPAQDAALTIHFPPLFANGSPVSVTFSREEVGNALVSACRAHKIPLPRGLTKRLEKLKDGAALCMESASTGIHALVIDDQKVVRAIVTRLLHQANITGVTEAESGHQALEILADPAFRADVIICDLHMDQMDGIEFLRRLRTDTNSINCHKPVLILTADKSERALVATREAGASKLLTKPVSAEELSLQIALVRGYFEAKPPTLPNRQD